MLPVRVRQMSNCPWLQRIGGWAGATFTPDWFVESQLDSGPVVASDNSRLVALQLGNAYGLLFLAAIAVLYTTTEPKVVRNYLVALLIADIGHVYVCFHVLGPDRFFEISQWNAVTWGNVGATVSRASVHSILDGLLTLLVLPLLHAGCLLARIVWSGRTVGLIKEDSIARATVSMT